LRGDRDDSTVTVLVEFKARELDGAGHHGLDDLRVNTSALSMLRVVSSSLFRSSDRVLAARSVDEMSDVAFLRTGRLDPECATAPHPEAVLGDDLAVG